MAPNRLGVLADSLTRGATLAKPEERDQIVRLALELSQLQQDRVGEMFAAMRGGIGFSIFVVGIAAMNLALDFDLVERGVEMRLPKDYEWVGALGIVVTIVWLYLEMLRLLSKLRQ